MTRLHLFNLIFTPRLLPTVFVLIVLPILISLGVWQLHRAEYKRQLQTQAQQQTTLELADINDQSLKHLQYRSIRITGHYDNAHPLLIDNKVMNHRVGYEVLTPFIPNNIHKVVLVNRGWIAGTGRRDRLPPITAAVGKQTIRGLIKIIPTKAFVLGKANNKQQWPMLLQAIDKQQLAKLYQKPLYPFVVLLSPQSPNGFIRKWRPVVVTSAKHLGYAVQWFALAVTLVIIYFVLSTTRKADD